VQAIRFPRPSSNPCNPSLARPHVRSDGGGDGFGSLTRHARNNGGNHGGVSGGHGRGGRDHHICGRSGGAGCKGFGLECLRLLLRVALEEDTASLGRTRAHDDVVGSTGLTCEAAHLGRVHGVNVAVLAHDRGHGEGLAALVHGSRGEQLALEGSTTGTLARGQGRVPIRADGFSRPTLASSVLAQEGDEVAVLVRDARAVPCLAHGERIRHVSRTDGGLGRITDGLGDGHEQVAERGARLSRTGVARLGVGPSLALVRAAQERSHERVIAAARGDRRISGVECTTGEAQVRASTGGGDDLGHASEVVENLLARVLDGLLRPLGLVALKRDVHGDGSGSIHDAGKVREDLPHFIRRRGGVHTRGEGGGWLLVRADDAFFGHGFESLRWLYTSRLSQPAPRVGICVQARGTTRLNARRHNV